ncbi:MAG: hypothetical protein KKI08_01735 [Armatimonadetes bacterium]|nr:hypothetical protein [Armatimonadota bacterium]
MRISEVIRLKPQAEGISLPGLQELREALDRESEELSLITGAQAGEIIEPYITPTDPAADPLYRFLKSIAGNGGRGAGLLVRGPRSSGKTHLLAITDLLLEYPRVRPLMAATHESYETVLKSLDRVDPLLVVPVPLEEHRAHDEHLEDIFFDRTEQELLRSRHGLSVPLSEHSYALDLIERHIIPRYGAELDAHVARLPGSQRSWKDLRERNAAAAVAAARAFAQEIGYPLDFRQSRVERLARLLDIISDRRFRGIVWLVDDLGQFLAATGQKAVRNDASFLEFLGQRSKIAPLYVLATMNTAPDQTAGIEPYMLANILDNYEVVDLTAADMRRVALQRSVSVTDEPRLAATVTDVWERYREAYGRAGFAEEDLQASYPLHPLAQTCLESIYSRFLNEADGLADFLQALSTSGAAAVLDRETHQLLSLQEILQHVAARLSAHPQAAPYLHEALEYYVHNGAQLHAPNPDLPVTLARSLVALRLGNLSAPLDTLVETIGLSEQGRPRVTVEQAREALEQMRLRGRYVDVRRGATPEGDAYYVDVEASLTEMARRQLVTLKGSLADDDPRVWDAAAAATSSAVLPLADLEEARLLEVPWANSMRGLQAQTCSLTSLSGDRLAARSADLADSGTVEDVRLHIAEVFRAAEQRATWRDAAAVLPQSRWAAGVLAWLPQELSAEELDRLKEFAACRSLLQAPGMHVDARLQDRLLEEASRLGNEVRAVIENAYMGGEVVSGQGTVARAADLAATRGDWPATLAAIAHPALARLYPRFRDIAPHQPLTVELTAEIVRHLLGPEGLQWPDDPARGEFTETILAPLQLVRRDGSTWRLQVEQSDAAGELMDRVRRRDQTPEHQPGRPMAYHDLQRHMAKSVFGLPATLYELLVTALIRAGYLVALDSSRQIIQLGELTVPLERSVTYLARAPLLSVSEWQDLTRATRVLLERMVPRADHALQTELWEALRAAREARTHELARLRRLVEALWQRLGQEPVQWRETMQALDDLQRVYEALDPDLLPAQSLAQFLGSVRPLLQGTPSRLSQLLREIQALEVFFERTAEDVVTIYDYLRSPELADVPDADFQNRRGQLLALIAGGERLIADETAFRRLVQIILSIYKRRYIAWHTRCYRMSVFDKYRTLKSAPELRVLAHLQRLDVKVRREGPQAVELVEAQEARRCVFPGLHDALDQTPTCPQCHLRLDEELELVPLEDIKAQAENEVAAYMAELRRPPFQETLATYAEALPHRGELATRLEQLLSLGDNPPARAVLAILTDEVIAHLNRVLSGQQIRPRNFGQLRTVLAGRTLSREEAQQLFDKWLAGDDSDSGDEGDEVIHVEP